MSRRGTRSTSLPMRTQYVARYIKLPVAITGMQWGGDASGLYSCRLSVDHESGKRVTAASAYYAPAAARPNIKLLTGAQVTKILFKPELVGGNRVAVGVEFSVDGQRYSVSVSKEVVLAAGVIQTPQILELSGMHMSPTLTWGSRILRD